MSEEKNEHTLASCLGLLLMLPVVVVADAFVVMKGWQWFVAPTFGVSVPSFAVVVGLRQLYTVAFARVNPNDKRKPAEIFTAGLVIDAIGLLVMWIAHTAGAA